MNRTTIDGGDAPALHRLLGQRFGNGLVYLEGSRDRRHLALAIRHGLVDADGILTAAGRRFAARPLDVAGASPRLRSAQAVEGGGRRDAAIHAWGISSGSTRPLPAASAGTGTI